MRTRTHSTFRAESERSKPVAVVDPASQVRGIGARITISGANSYVEGEEEITTYTWEVVGVPLGSRTAEREMLDVDGDGTSASFAPDVTGRYTIRLTVATAYRSSDPVDAIITVQAVLVPYLGQATPDGDFMFTVLSDFWHLVDNRQALPVLWSGYNQVVASDLLRLWQIDYGKSIRDIQPLFQRRWLDYSPKLPLGPVSGVYGHHQSGNGAFTGSALGACIGCVISDREFVLFSGSVSQKAIGTDLRVYTGSNVGNYTISKLNADRSGYLVSTSSRFPATDALLAGSTLYSTQLSDTVGDPTADFATAGVEEGDVLRIETGTDADYYTVVAVGVTTLQIDKALARTRTGLSYTVFSASRASVAFASGALTDTVYIPQSEADFDLYEADSVGGDGVITSPVEVLVERRHVYRDMIGKSITITSGVNTGHSFVVAAINSSSTGYIIASVFAGTFEHAATYTLPLLADVTSRLLVLAGKAYTILSAELNTSLPDVDDGGRGPLWVITLGEANAPSGLEELHWRVAATLTSADVDFEAAGVCGGDLLLIDLMRDDQGLAGHVPCTVLGAVGGKVAFDIGAATLEPGDVGALTDAELVALGADLHVPYIYVDSANSLQITSAGAVLQDLWNSLAFKRTYYNLVLETGTVINTDYFGLEIRPQYIIRNSRIAVDETIVSVPALFEYISEPVTRPVDEGVLLLTKDDEQTVLVAAPVVLLENNNFIVQGDELRGAFAATQADSELLVIPSGALTGRDIQPGDTITLTSGFDQRTYVILEVRDDETLRITSEDGLPGSTATGVHYTITRSLEGSFIRFVPGTFTPEAPAPGVLWAETTLFDNSEHIEDNFGVMVALTKEQFDAYGTTQVSYRGAVTGLMYAWAKGPTLGTVALGASVLLGLPVTEAAGIILDIDEAYGEQQGRILVEDVSPEGNGTGVVRSYYFTPVGDYAYSIFSGVATNPATGAVFAAGDNVEAFQPLSKGVVVYDYVKDPNWWRVGTPYQGRELAKLHTWGLLVDAEVIDSRDMPLVTEFANAIRPIHTKPQVVLVRYLHDSITMAETLEMDATLYHFDDIAFSLETTHIVDDYNGGSLALRQVNVGSFGTRVLFEGHDLVMTLGSDTVVSARGGFVVPLESISSAFETVTTRGAGLVRAADDARDVAGDVLYIQTGPNEGRFEVVEVVSDTTLRVRQIGVGASVLPLMGPDSPDPANMQEAESTAFWVERLNRNPLCVGSVAVTTGSTLLTDVDATFVVDGVTIDDVLVIEGGAFRGRYRVTEVLQDTDTLESTSLSFTPAFPAGGDYTAAYHIEREALYANPLLAGAGDTTTGSREITVVNAGLSPVRTGDVLTILTAGADMGDYNVITVLGTDTVVVSRPLVNTATVDFYVERANREDLPDSDAYVERFSPNDELLIEVLRPRSIFGGLGVVDGTLSAAGAGSAGTATSATDFAAALVTTDMVLQVSSGTNNDGVYAITDVTGTVLTIEGLFFQDSAGPYIGAEVLDILEDATEFHVQLATVDSNAPFNYETMGIRAGDIFRFSEGDFVIRNVVAGTLTLVESTGVGPADYTGVILRRRLSA